MDVLVIFVACVLVALAWYLLILAVPRHQPVLLGKPLAPGRARAARIAGWVALVASLAGFVQAIGWEQGPVFWAAVLMLAAIAWVLLLTRLRDAQ